MKPISIQTELKARPGESQWRLCLLSTQGESFLDLVTNALITEVDEDGGDLSTYSLNDATRTVYSEAIETIERTYWKATSTSGNENLLEVSS